MFADVVVVISFLLLKHTNFASSEVWILCVIGENFSLPSVSFREQLSTLASLWKSFFFLLYLVQCVLLLCAVSPWKGLCCPLVSLKIEDTEKTQLSCLCMRGEEQVYSSEGQMCQDPSFLLWEDPCKDLTGKLSFSLAERCIQMWRKLRQSRNAHTPNEAVHQRHGGSHRLFHHSGWDRRIANSRANQVNSMNIFF